MQIKNHHNKNPDISAFYISPQKLFAYDCVTLYLDNKTETDGLVRN